MMDRLKNILTDIGISEYGVIDFDKLNVINPRLMPVDTDIACALMILMPYRCDIYNFKDGLNAGLFARCKDYHAYFRTLAEKLIPSLTQLSGGKVFAFADHSPIDEKDAAVKCGLGDRGKNSLLINNRFGSYVFIGTFLLEKRIGEIIHSPQNLCSRCNKCVSACPVGAIFAEGGVEIQKCLSCVSQKSTKNDSDKELLAKHKTVWGCDICQEACPINKKATLSNNKYFSEGVIDCFSTEFIDEMSEEEYSRYAFSYRKRRVIRENCLTATKGYDIIKDK